MMHHRRFLIENYDQTIKKQYLKYGKDLFRNRQDKNGPVNSSKLIKQSGIYKTISLTQQYVSRLLKYRQYIH